MAREKAAFFAWPAENTDAYGLTRPELQLKELVDKTSKLVESLSWLEEEYRNMRIQAVELDRMRAHNANRPRGAPHVRYSYSCAKE